VPDGFALQPRASLSHGSNAQQEGFYNDGRLRLPELRVGMTRGNQRDTARAKNQAKDAVSG
jgi:hypothetical protein